MENILYLIELYSPARGAEIYVTENKSLPKYYEQTSRLANNILNKLGELNIGNRGVRTKLIERDTTDVYSDGTRADYYGIIRYAMRGCHIDDGRIWGGSPANVQNGEGVPTILIEHCFIKGSDFADFLNTDEKIRNIAIADGKGIVENYGLKTEAELEENRVDSVSLDISSYNMKIDDTITLNAKVMPEASKFKEVIWTSSDTNVATVSQDGVVSGVGVGTATITVTTTKENRTASMVVTVEEKPLDEKYSIDFSGINESNGMLTNIELNTTVGQLKQKIIKSDNLYIEVIDKNGNLLNDNKNVATSIKVLLKDIETSRLVRTYTVVIYGDTDGDGMLSSKDALAIIKNKVGKIEFENEYFLEAGRVCIETRNVKSVPSSRDALNIIKCKIGETEIDQSI